MEARILNNGGITSNGDPNEEMGFPFVDLAKKIKNIDGRVLGKGGNVVRGKVVSTSPGRLISFDDDVIADNVSRDSNMAATLNLNVNGMLSPGVPISMSEQVKDSTFADLGSLNLNDSGLAKDVSANANTTSPKMVGNGGDMRMNGTKVPDSFASLLKNKNKVVQISELRNDECVKGAAVALPWSAIEEVSSRFENTLYGYFVGKCLAFKLVENYVMNAWAKFGVKRVQSHGEFFLFQFETKEGMDRVIDSGPWLIRMVPLILNVWYPDSDLLKAEIKRVPVWVKLRHVPLVAYSEVGLSLITTQIGKPIRLDAYTSNMCLNSWGRSEYARALIEVSAEDDPKDELVIAIPIGKDKGHSLATIRIEYEWTPPRCSTCCIFDHTDLKCPKRYKEGNSVVTPNVEVNHSKDVADDGFEAVKKKRNKMKKHQKQVDGVVLNKPSLTLHYRRVDKGNSTQKSGSNVASTSKVSGLATATSDQSKKIRLENSFSALNDDGDGEWQNTNVLNESDSDVDEVITFDDRGGSLKIT